MNETNNKSKTHLKPVLLGIGGILISAASLFFVFRDIDPYKLLDTVNRIKPVPLIISIALYWGGLVVTRTFLVKYILASKGDLPFKRVFRCISIGFLANNILPFRIGDVARGAAISNVGKISFSTVIGGMALERMLDFLMAALIAFLAIITVPNVPIEIQTTAIWAAVILSLALLILMVLVRSNLKESKSSGLLTWIWNLWIRFSSGFNILKSVKGVALLLLLGIVMWSFGVASIIAKLEAFGIPATLPAAFLVFSCLGFSVALPSAPGYVGVYQIAIVIALTTLGVDETVAAAFGLFSWIVDISAGNVAGAIGMIQEGMTLKDIKAASSKMKSSQT